MKFFDAKDRFRTLPRSSNYLIDWNQKARSKFQTQVKEFLRDYWKYERVYEEMPIVGTRLTLDIYNDTRKVAIEVQGRQHTKFVKHFHGNRDKFLAQLHRDEKKLDFCRKNDITLIEIYPSDAINVDFFMGYGSIL